jgi:hypothetical protein
MTLALPRRSSTESRGRLQGSGVVCAYELKLIPHAKVIAELAAEAQA